MKTKTFKQHVPNSKTLPPLLDKHAETKRLISIAKEQDKIAEEKKKKDNLNNILKDYKKSKPL